MHWGKCVTCRGKLTCQPKSKQIKNEMFYKCDLIKVNCASSANVLCLGNMDVSAASSFGVFCKLPHVLLRHNGLS